MNNYNSQLAIMKGFAISLVVVGHCTTYQFIESLVNQFHLAIFFFISGYFINTNYNTKIFIYKKIKSLYIPFVLICSTFLIAHNFLYTLNLNKTLNENTLEYYISELINIFIKLYTNEPLMGAMWFCTALLFTSILTFIPLYYFKHKCNLIFFCIFFISTIALYFNVKSPYCIWQYCIISIIVYLGYIFKNNESKINILFTKNRSIIFCISSFFIIVFLTKMGYLAALQPNSINNENTIVILFIATLGCLMTYSFSSLIIKTLLGKILEILGNNSFFIMTYHFLSFKIISFIQCYFYKYDYKRISDFPIIENENIIWFILYIIVGTTIPCMCSVVFKRIKMRYSIYGRNNSCNIQKY